MGPVGVLNVTGVAISELKDEPAKLASLDGETVAERIERRLSRWTPMTLRGAQADTWFVRCRIAPHVQVASRSISASTDCACTALHLDHRLQAGLVASLMNGVKLAVENS